MRFTKMHGAGNDFVVVDARAVACDWAALARATADRHLGVGADGLILVLPSERADVRMRMFNPDGSEAEMCGNGIRCLVKFAVERGIVAAQAATIHVETMLGTLGVAPLLEGGKVVRARVGMGVPGLRPEDVPVDPALRLAPIGAGYATAQLGTAGLPERLSRDEMVFGWPVALPGRSVEVTGVSMGNPHAVAFLQDPVADFPLGEVGPQVERHPLFPRRVNFEVVNVLDRGRLAARVWERGAGLTMACGTGACAAAVAARLHGYTDERVDITLPGGVLTVTWDGVGEIVLEGPVMEVFQGEWRD